MSLTNSSGILSTFRTLLKHNQIEVDVKYDFGSNKPSTANPFLICGERRNFLLAITAKDPGMLNYQLAMRLTAKLESLVISPEISNSSSNASRTPSLHKMRSVESLRSSVSNASMEALSTKLGQSTLENICTAQLIDSQTIHISIPVYIDSELDFERAVALLKFQILEEIHDTTMQTFLSRNSASVYMLRKILDEATLKATAQGGTPLVVREVDFSVPVRRCIFAEARLVPTFDHEAIIHVRIVADESCPKVIIHDIRLVPGERHLAYQTFHTEHLSSEFLPMTMVGLEKAGFAFKIKSLPLAKEIIPQTHLEDLPIHVDIEVEINESLVHLSFESMADFSSLIPTLPKGRVQIKFFGTILPKKIIF